MGLSYYIALPKGLDDDTLERLGTLGISREDGTDDVMSFGGWCSDVLDSIAESQPGFSYDQERTEVARGAIAWAGPMRDRLMGLDVMRCAALMGDERGGEAVSDWLDGVTMRRTTSAEVPIACSVDLPDLRCVLDRDAQYLHSQTLRERLEGTGDDALAFDVRPTVTAAAGTAKVRHTTSEVTCETEERDPRLALMACTEFERAIGDGSGIGHSVRANVRDLVRMEPASAMGLLGRLASLHGALAQADVATFVIERSW